jgi:chromosome segregation ATPase
LAQLSAIHDRQALRITELESALQLITSPPPEDLSARLAALSTETAQTESAISQCKTDIENAELRIANLSAARDTDLSGLATLQDRISELTKSLQSKNDTLRRESEIRRQIATSRQSEIAVLQSKVKSAENKRAQREKAIGALQIDVKKLAFRLSQNPPTPAALAKMGDSFLTNPSLLGIDIMDRTRQRALRRDESKKIYADFRQKKSELRECPPTSPNFETIREAVQDLRNELIARSRKEALLDESCQEEEDDNELILPELHARIKKFRQQRQEFKAKAALKERELAGLRASIEDQTVRIARVRQVLEGVTGKAHVGLRLSDSI